MRANYESRSGSRLQRRIVSRGRNLSRFFAAADQQAAQSRRRYKAFGGIAAAAAVVAVVAIMAGNRTDTDVGEQDDYLIADALLNSTQWTAPSDALMPSHQFDVYQEIPVLMESTDSQEGSLL